MDFTPKKFELDQIETSWFVLFFDFIRSSFIRQFNENYNGNKIIS